MREDLDNMRDAIALLTAWTELPGDWANFHALLGDVATDGSHDRMILGLISLAGGLLHMRQHEVGQTPQQTLQHVARLVADGEATLGQPGGQAAA